MLSKLLKVMSLISDKPRFEPSNVAPESVILIPILN